MVPLTVPLGTVLPPEMNFVSVIFHKWAQIGAIHRKSDFSPNALESLIYKECPATDSGTRTRTVFPPTDFKSVASTISPCRPLLRVDPVIKLNREARDEKVALRDVYLYAETCEAVLSPLE